ncbi:MAG TPA: PAS domain S-box protein [Chitinispirillaceae bacterium]|nr:PAS domain S-box protein [Chitinispirillaceae bacterium]
MVATLKDFYAKNPNLVLIVGKDGTVLYSNEASEPLMHGWNAGVGRKVPSFIVDIVQSVISRNNPEKLEVRVGNKAYLLVLHPLPEEERVNISGFNISDQKEPEEKPLESKEIHYEIFNLMEEAIQICEIVFNERGQPIDNIILDVNAAYEKHSGLKREEVIGRRIKEVLPVIEQIWLDRYAEVVRTGRKMHFEEYNASVDKWFDVSASPIGGNRFIATFRNITDRKLVEESEERLKALMNYNPSLVFMKDKYGRYVYLNNAYEKQFVHTKD